MRRKLFVQSSLLRPWRNGERQKKDICNLELVELLNPHVFHSGDGVLCVKSLSIPSVIVSFGTNHIILWCVASSRHLLGDLIAS